MKLNITIEMEDLKKTPVTDMTDKQVENITDKLPKKVVKLPKDESQIEPGQNAKPLKYTVKKGDTIKSIAEHFGVSYGELSNSLMSIEGTTSIHDGDEIEIPRHFIDMSKAT